MLVYNRIKTLAKAQEKAICKIEEACGLANGSIAKWNTVSPTAKSLKKVANYLGVTVDSLLAEDSEAG